MTTKHDNRDAAETFLYAKGVTFGGVPMSVFVQITEQMAAYAAEKVAADRTRIVAELNAIGNKETDLHDYAKDIHEYLEQLRGADTESDNTEVSDGE